MDVTKAGSLQIIKDVSKVEFFEKNNQKPA